MDAKTRGAVVADERDALLQRALLLQKAKQIQAQKLAAQQPPPPEDEGGALDTALEYGGKGLDVGLRSLDLLGGLARTAYVGSQNIPRAVAKGLEAVGVENEYAKKPHLITSEDYIAALQGRAPTMSEFAVRQGAEPGFATSAEGMAADAALDPLNYITFGTAPLIKNTAKIGRSIYKSGLKALDQEALKYGKEPVSDLLLKEGVTGSYEQIQKKMDELAAGYLQARDYILKKATRAGAEVDMGEAMAPLLSKIDEIEKSGDPNLMATAKMMRADAQKYLAKGAKEPESILRELPVQAEYRPAYSEIKGFEPTKQEILELPVQAEYKGPYRTLKTPEIDLPIGKVQPPGTVAELEYRRGLQKLKNQRGPYSEPFKEMIRNPNINVEMGQLVPEEYILRAPEAAFVEETGKAIAGKTVPEQYILRAPEVALDVTERVSGPTPLQTSAWKSSTYNKIGSPAFQELKQTPVGKELLKAKAYGLKKGTETSVEKSLGKLDAEELRDLNSKLGQILTSDEKALREAFKEANKNAVSSVDAPLALINPGAALLKKIADVAKMTGPRTEVGKSLVDRSKSGMMLEKNILQSPWLQINRERED